MFKALRNFFSFGGAKETLKSAFLASISPTFLLPVTFPVINAIGLGIASFQTSVALVGHAANYSWKGAKYLYNKARKESEEDAEPALVAKDSSFKIQTLPKVRETVMRDSQGMPLEKSKISEEKGGKFTFSVEPLGEAEKAKALEKKPTIIKPTSDGVGAKRNKNKVQIIGEETPSTSFSFSSLKKFLSGNEKQKTNKIQSI